MPREIRYYVYDNVTHFDPPSKIVWGYLEEFEHGYQTKPTKAPDTKFCIPWINLLLTCKAIRMEVDAYVNMQSRVDKENATWTVELAIGNGRVTSSRWRHIPCNPTQAETLVAKLQFPHPKARFWGCGGPMPVVRELYQTLNWLLHYGPALSRQTRLSQPLKFKTLVLRVATLPPDESGKKGGGFRSNYDEICTFVSILKGTGLIWGYIDSIRVISEDGDGEKNITVDMVENAEVPKAWDRYGFEWGVQEVASRVRDVPSKGAA
ncbi:hypothetical protein GQ53DRAFT_742592 [Thozetella sp. PMI_491]|nr:hypothetical protein GQ53DRAFT_742592 [Thozetella sp. PMI_491]